MTNLLWIPPAIALGSYPSIGVIAGWAFPRLGGVDL